MNELLIFVIIFVSLLVILTPLVIASKRLRDREAMELAAETGAYDVPSMSHQAASVPAPKPTPRRAPPVMSVAPVVTPATIPVAPTAVVAQQLATPVRALRLEQTLRILNDSLHLMLVGESNAGKSTAAEAVMASRAESGDLVVILDPHADPTTWCGLPAVGTGRDYEAIAVAMDGLLAEMSDRYRRKAAGDTDYPAVTIFIDEWPAIQLHCKQAGAFMAQMAQEARKVAMRLVILTQSDRVESLGLSGKGDVRENFVMLLLGNKATAALPETVRMSRPGAVRKGSQMLPATVDGLDVVGKQFQPRASMLYVLSASADHPQAVAEDREGFDLDRELARFLSLPNDLQEPAGEVIRTGSEMPVEAVVQGESTPPKPVLEMAVLPHRTEQKPVSEPVQKDLPQDDLSRAIRALVLAGISRNKVIELLSLGSKAPALKRIKEALGEVIEEPELKKAA